MNASLRAALYAIAAGFLFITLDAAMKFLSGSMPPFQVMFLRFLMGLVVMLPFILRDGVARYRPRNLAGQGWRALVQTAGLVLLFSALPHIPLADVTAISFTTPLFVMLGAVLFLGERANWRRWTAAGVGFLGVLIVVAPGLSGAGGFHNLILLASAPFMAASILITKALTRVDGPKTIVVWQAIGVCVCAAPLALPGWQWPTAWEWALLLGAGMFGSLGHWLMAHSLILADISATQPLRFLTIIWSVLYGWLLFADQPSLSTLAGAAVIFAATSWIARHEARRP